MGLYVDGSTRQSWPERRIEFTGLGVSTTSSIHQPRLSRVLRCNHSPPFASPPTTSHTQTHISVWCLRGAHNPALLIARSASKTVRPAHRGFVCHRLCHLGAPPGLILRGKARQVRHKPDCANRTQKASRWFRTTSLAPHGYRR